MKGKKDRTVLKYEKLLQERKIEQLPIIGVDIGSRMIKIVQMKKNGTIKKWCAEDIPTAWSIWAKLKRRHPLPDSLKEH